MLAILTWDDRFIFYQFSVSCSRTSCGYVCIYIILNVKGLNEFCGNNGTLSLISSKYAIELVVLISNLVWSNLSARIARNLYITNSILSKLAIPSIATKLQTSIGCEAHINCLIVRTIPTYTVLKDDIHIFTFVGITPPVTIFLGNILCSFSSIRPNPYINLVSPSVRNFSSNGNSISWLNRLICWLIYWLIRNDETFSIELNIHLIWLITIDNGELNVLA